MIKFLTIQGGDMESLGTRLDGKLKVSAETGNESETEPKLKGPELWPLDFFMMLIHQCNAPSHREAIGKPSGSHLTLGLFLMTM